MFRVLVARMTALAVDESGMSTVEYAIGTIAAAAFGAILYTVVTGDSIVTSPPFAPVPGAPLAPLPTNGRPNSA